MAENKENQWNLEFRNLLSALPEQYADAKVMANTMSHAFHQELANALGPRLNSYLKTVSPKTHQERQAIASWCNHELHGLHLAIRCPRTNRPSVLLADYRSRDDQTSRFRLQARDEKGQTSRTYTSNDLPTLELMEDPPRREGLSRWRDSSDDKGPSR